MTPPRNTTNALLKFFKIFSYNNQVFMRKMVNHIRQGEIEPFARKEDLDGETNK